MQIYPRLSLILDVRHTSSTNKNKFPVKLRATFKSGQRWIQQYYHSGVYLDEKEYKRIFKAPKDKSEEILRDKMDSMLKRAIKLSSDIPSITPKTFQDLFAGNSRESLTNYFKFQRNKLTDQGRAGSALIYESALNSFTAFHNNEIHFSDVTVDWVERYQDWMLAKNRSITSIGINLRALRGVFNSAIDDKIITLDMYPFGRSGFSIRTERKMKLPLDDKQISTLKKYKPKDPDQEKALAFWLFCYYCNGMNIADVLNLKLEDIQGEFLTYDRNKTKRTKHTVRVIYIPMRKEVKDIILRYGNRTLSPKAYLFDVLSDDLTPAEKKMKIYNFIKTTNKFMKRIAKDLNIKKLTTGLARHTFANQLLNSGTSTDFLQYALGHNNITTTEHYKGSFLLDKIKKENRKL